MSKRVDRLKNHISIEKLLSDYGYDVREVNREQQFRCDLHGDGNDNAPSARSYPESDSWYCFACGKVRDIISTVREREGVDFNKACTLLEKKYGLSVWESSRKEVDPLEEKDDQPTDIDDIRQKTVRRLERLTDERAISFENALRLWEAINLLSHSSKQSVGQWGKVYERLP